MLSVLAGCAAPAPPAAPQGARVLAGFDRAPPGPLAGWVVQGGTWTVEAGPDAPSAPNVLRGGSDTAGPALVLVPDQRYADVTVSVNLTGGAAGVAFRVMEGNFTLVTYDAAQGQVRVAHRAVGAMVEDASIAAPSRSPWTSLSAHVRGDRVTVFLGASQVLAAKVPPGEGLAGLAVAGGAARFDDLVVDPER